jgi:hypothetical protein
MLPILLQMLLAGKYRHVTFDESAAGHDIFRFEFTDIDADPDFRLSLIPR